MTQGLRSATIFSVAADPPRAFEPEPNSHADFDAAFLTSPILRHPCSLQRLSAAGATLAVRADLVPGEPMNLELANGQSIPGTIDWCANEEAGLVFDAPIDVIGALARNLACQPEDRRHMPRVEIRQPVYVRQGARIELAHTRNISQGGVCIATRLDLDEGEPVQLTFDSLRPFAGVVRWLNDGQAGVSFDEELAWQVLMPWLRRAHLHQERASPLPFGLEPEGMIPDKHAIRLEAPARIREGTRWWNARVRALTAHLVELETRAALKPGTQLWVSLPEIGGGPANVIEAAHNRILCEFRLPLRARDLGLLSAGPTPR